jgi:hypothetical protein
MNWSQIQFHHLTRIPVSRGKRGERFSTQESDVIYLLAMIKMRATELFERNEQAST